jgi:hypothetical protein
MRRHTIFLHSGHLKQLGALAQSRGLKASQLVRLSIVEYLRREKRKK